jgi:hypothetical protein
MTKKERLEAQRIKTYDAVEDAIDLSKRDPTKTWGELVRDTNKQNEHTQRDDGAPGPSK